MSDDRDQADAVVMPDASSSQPVDLLGGTIMTIADGAQLRAARAALRLIQAELAGVGCATIDRLDRRNGYRGKAGRQTLKAIEQALLMRGVRTGMGSVLCNGGGLDWRSDSSRNGSCEVDLTCGTADEAAAAPGGRSKKGPPAGRLPVLAQLEVGPVRAASRARRDGASW